MKIIIDSLGGIVSFDSVARRVVFPAKYLTTDVLYFDTTSLGGFGNIADEKLPTGTVLAIAWALWRASTVSAPSFLLDVNGAVRGDRGAAGYPGARGLPGPAGVRGLDGEKGETGSVTDMVADPLAYYILAKN
jgi:hypothetical protein